MNCYLCKAIDSMCVTMYLDKNRKVFSESELEAFRVLHPEASRIEFRKISVCGMCKYEIDIGKKSKF